MAARYAPLSRSSKRFPSFLYLRGRIFYYRHRLPQRLAASGSPREIRICLHTPYQAVARKLSLHLHGLTEQMLETWQMAGHIPNIPQQIEAFRALLREEVAKIIETGPKNPIKIQELQKRLDAYLTRKLDEDLVNTDLPPMAEIQRPDKPVEIITPGEAFADKAAQIQSDLNSGEDYDSHYHDAIMELTQQSVLSPAEITEQNAQAIVKSFMIMQVKLHKILAARYNGDYAMENQLCPPASMEVPDIPTPETGRPDKLPPIRLSDLIEKYISTNLSDGKWVSQTVSDHRNRVSSLLLIIGDIDANEISRTHIRTFRDTLKKLPPRWQKALAKPQRTLENIIADNKGKAALSVKTINTAIESVSSMFTWAINEGLMRENPAKGLALKDATPEIDKKQPLSKEDIKQLFFTSGYIPTNFKKPSYYWCPLISLYTGMRLEEICQLHCEDIYEENGIWLIDVREPSTDDLDDKCLKNVNATRKIPIHSELIKRGLLDYLTSIRSNGNNRLFPELNKTKKSPKYGKQVGKHFKAYLESVGISEGKSFHSLRHSFSDYFKKRNLHTDMFRQVFGHGNTYLAAKRYGSRFTPREIYESLISLIDYQ